MAHWGASGLCRALSSLRSASSGSLKAQTPRGPLGFYCVALTSFELVIILPPLCKPLQLLVFIKALLVSTVSKSHELKLCFYNKSPYFF